MSATVHISFNHTWSDEELYAAAKDWAVNVKPTVPGLIWKIFVEETEERGSCGIYLFENLASAQAYADGELVQSLIDAPFTDNIKVRVSNVLEEASKLADAPVA